MTDSTQYFPTKIPLRRYFSGLAAVGYSLLLFSLLLTPYFSGLAAVGVGYSLLLFSLLLINFHGSVDDTCDCAERGCATAGGRMEIWHYDVTCTTFRRPRR